MHRWPGCFLALLLTAPVAAFAEPSDPLENLQAWMYRYELCSYCSLSDQAIHDGYRIQSQRLVEQHDISREVYEATRMRAWVAVYREWQNRGLGGFKNWCRTEGEAAAQMLRSAAGDSG
ncbi:MAG: hypothetical protein KDJ38_20685 [Gammaproteobacteria bacterium]|nr:hypothetical protein [Gammaproteobacteria bacterium]